MADVQSNIKVSIDTTDALASIKNLQRQISAFHTSMAKSGAAANAVTAGMQQNLINSVNATGKFAAQMKTIKTTTESFTSSLEKNKFSIGEYFRYAGGASKTFGRLFKSEFETINKVARENVKDLQTQYIKLGRDANGAMKAIAVRPLTLDMNDLATKTMIASEKQALLNQLLKQGSTSLLNFGKNTQWAGRQLMVGFTVPLIAVGSQAAKTFMDMETQAIRFKKVYGDLFTPQAESKQALQDITNLGKEFTKYGVAVSDTVGLAADAAAAGFQGLDLQNQTTAATRLSILGQIDNQKALETTISLQNAFGTSSDKLAASIDFLNAVENQTVVSLDDITTAIPKVAPVIKQMGGDVKDLAFFLTAMKEGGINASEGANALKSGLASMINPTSKASAMLAGFGINIKKIVVDNKGDLKKTVVDFATALNQLDPLNRAQAIEQMFGKFQFARLSTLFANVTKEGTQASRVLDLAGSSVQELANLSEKELGITAESSMNKFKKAVEDLKLTLVPVGEEFLKAATPIVEFVGKILEKFNNLGDGTKKVIVTLTAVVAGLGPVLLMTFGLLANGIANIIKGFVAVKTIFNKTGQSSATLGTEVKYMTTEQRNAAAVAASLDQVHRTLAQTFTSEASAVNALTAAYQRAITAQAAFMPTGVPMGRGPVKKRSGGKPAVVGGTGNQDTELALLTPGETVIPADMSNKYGGLINGMIADNIPGYSVGKKSRVPKPISERTQDVPVYGDLSIFVQDRIENQSQGASAPGLENVLAPLVARVAEARGLGFSQQTQAEHYPGIIDQYRPIVQTFVDTIGTEMEATQTTIVGENERLARAWQAAGRSVEAELAAIPNEVERGRVRQALGIEADSYGSVAGDFRASHGWGGRTARYAPGQGPASYMDPSYRRGTSAAYEMLTGRPIDTKTQDYGHPFDVRTRAKLGLPTTIPLEELRRDASTNPATISTINNSIAREEEKAARNRTVGQAATTTEEAVTAVRTTAKTASPSKRTIPVGQDIARGLSEGMKQETPRVVAEANKMTDSAIKSTRTRRRAASRAQGAPTPIGNDIIGTGSSRGRRGNRRSSRPQGPSNNIGPLMPAGATQLGLVSMSAEEKKALKKQRAKNARVAKAKAMSSKVGRLGGGMGLMSANMALGAMPDFAGKGIIQSTMTGASMGMLFGPWGAAAGGAIGLVSTAIGKLIDKEKQHNAIVKSTFQSSAAEVSIFGGQVLDASLKLQNIGVSIEGLTGKFGNLNPQIQQFVDMVNKLDTKDPLKLFVEGLKTDKFSSLVGNIRTKVSTEVASGTIDIKDAQKYVMGYLAAAGRASEFSKVWKELSFSLQTETKATETAFNKLYGQVWPDLVAGSIAGNEKMMFSFGKVLNTYDNLDPKLQNVSDQMLNFAGIMSNGSLKLESFNTRMAGLRSSALNSKTGVDALAIAIRAAGNPDAIAAFDQIRLSLQGINGDAAKAADAILLMTINSMGASKEVSDWGKKNAGRLGLNPMEMSQTSGSNPVVFKDWWNKVGKKKYSDWQKEQAAAIASLNGNTNPYVDPTTTNGGAKAENPYLKILQKQIDALKAKRDAQKEANDEVQRQIDLEMKMQDLANQATQAKISGNYLQAAMLGQESKNVQMKFNQETELKKKDAEIAALEARYQAIKDGATLTAAEKAKLPKKAGGGLIKGPGTGRSDSIRATLGYAGGGQIRVSNGEFVVKASSVGQYGLDKLNAVNNGTADISTNSGTTVYNINMPITSNNANPSGVAEEVMRRLKVELNKNNKSNAVRM